MGIQMEVENPPAAVEAAKDVEGPEANGTAATNGESGVEQAYQGKVKYCPGTPLEPLRKSGVRWSAAVGLTEDND